MYVEIAFPISSYKIFTYKVPLKLRDQIRVGLRVKAPFNNRKLTGIVVEVSNSNKYKGKTQIRRKYIFALWGSCEALVVFKIFPPGVATISALGNHISEKCTFPQLFRIS